MKKSVNESIKLSLLLLNIENPRFDLGENQRDVVQKMIEDQGDKLYRLAEHIVKHGLNPSELAIVTPSEREDGRYEVLEGNRRVTALKILTTPSLIDVKYKSLTNKIKKLSTAFKKRGIKNVPCVIFDDPKEATKWIKLKHTGQNGGVGTVEWDNQQQARYDAKTEGKAPNSAIQIIDYLRKSPDFDKDLKAKLKDVPATSLGRLLGDPVFREFVGLSQDDGILKSNFEPAETIKPLTKVIRDLLKPKFTVNDIYYKEDRLKYIEGFSKAEIPEKKKASSPWPLAKPSAAQPLPAKAKKKSNPHSTDRKTLIPREFIVRITDKRINDIYHELKNLEISEYENSASVTFRVLLELGVDAFIQTKSITSVNSTQELYKKVKAVADYLETNSILSDKQLKPIRNAVGDPNSLLNMNTFNAYVHNRHIFPSERNLKNTWNNMELFIEKVLESI